MRDKAVFSKLVVAGQERNWCSQANMQPLSCTRHFGNEPCCILWGKRGHILADVPQSHCLHVCMASTMDRLGAPSARDGAVGLSNTPSQASLDCC